MVVPFKDLQHFPLPRRSGVLWWIQRPSQSPSRASPFNLPYSSPCPPLPKTCDVCHLPGEILLYNPAQISHQRVYFLLTPEALSCTPPNTLRCLPHRTYGIVLKLCSTVVLNWRGQVTVSGDILGCLHWEEPIDI